MSETEENVIPHGTVFLIVDDNEATLAMIRQGLRSIGLQDNIVKAKNVKEARERIEHQQFMKNPVGFIISDWNMPGESGLDFLAYIRTHENEGIRNLPFLMLTTNNEKSQILQAIEMGVSNYLIKPWSPKMFMDKVFISWQIQRKKKIEKKVELNR